MIAAMAKAESLAHYAKSQGARLSSFVLVLTAQEAYELLDWYGEGYPDPLLLDDIEAARLDGDPWRVLEHFNLLGLSMTRPTALH